MTSPRIATTDQAGARQSFHDAIAKQNLAPLWERVSGLVTRTPQPAALPAHWQYATVRASLLEAGRLLTAEEAERRVLILENPGLRGRSQATDSLFSGLQLLLPGERADAHRHAASALRLFLEGSGAYTSVDGERTNMERGDFVITPSWTWHAHGNDGADPVIWLDGLDVPMVNLFKASFSEGSDAKNVSDGPPAGDCEARFGGALVPDGYKVESPATAGRLSSPLLNYRYARARESLAAMLRNGPVDPCHGVKLRYVNPVTGGSAMPTMSAAIQLLPRGIESAPYRSTDGTVFVVVEGRGRSQIGDASFDWNENDIFVAPSWAPQRHHAESEAVLFSFSDRAAQEKLGLWREQRELAP
ncbi:MAG TPA: gentisate 1,2-dioxygenase [Candidatus Acidoferrales bacterium]|nr:gentisate 1,2-dioxygenase [Candidatus Acidoferrales bacterium]